MNIVKEIQDLFKKESESSPMLLADLASMEQYISESYHSRSIIELLQNADDSNSKRFYITSDDDWIIVANDGRYFNDKDAMSICRSGSSTKKRDGNTIGYRGIGFKSVVNLAQRVHIISNNLKMTFSKELTIDMLGVNTNVPLVRIPHAYTPLRNYDNYIKHLTDDNYTTIFIFEKVNIENFYQDLSTFDSSILLFLKHIDEVTIKSKVSKSIKSIRELSRNDEIITINENNLTEKWLVNRDNEGSAIAFILDENNRIYSLNNERSIIHSFMPTGDKCGFPMKINGDFSTDPSRTKIVYDNISKTTLKNCSKLIVELIKKYIEGEENYSGVFSILSEFSRSKLTQFTSNKKIKDYLFEEVKNNLNKTKWYNNVKLEKLYLNPQWINCNDFMKFCNYIGGTPINNESEIKYPGILKFCEVIDIKSLDLNELLPLTNYITLSIDGCVEIICQIIKKYRFSSNPIIKEKIQNSALIYVNDRVYSIKEIKKDFILNQKFKELLINNVNDINDLRWFFNQFFGDVSEQILVANGILKDKDNYSNINDTYIKNVNEKISDSVKSSPYSQDTHKNNIKKWRSAETNLVSILNQQPDVKRALDRSQSNLGYDIEVYYNDGSVNYIEVKSVERLGDSISLTNNEYSTANELKDDYLIAIVNQSEYQIRVCYIKNPIETLNLIKRVTRWEWLCDSYKIVEIDYSF